MGAAWLLKMLKLDNQSVGFVGVLQFIQQFIQDVFTVETFKKGHLNYFLF